MELINSPIILKMKFKESDSTSLLDLSSFFYYFNLLYDFSVIISLYRYKNYKFSQFFWYRKGRPIWKEHQLFLKEIQHKFPLEVVVIIGVIGAFWALVQAIEKIYNWKINREKLELEVKNLKLDYDQKYMVNQKKYVELDYIIEKREAMKTFSKILTRLERSVF